MNYRTVLSTALLAGSAIAMAGCASTPVGTGGELQVVATTTQIADYTRNIVGDVPVQLVQLADANQSLHGFDPSAGDLAAIGTADVLIVNGGGLDEWIEDAIDSSGFSGTLVDTTEGISLEVGADEEGHAGHDHEEEHADGDHSGHDHGDGDPHVWQSIDNAMIQTHTIIDALSAADPDNASTFEINGQAYLDELETLNDWVHENVDAVPHEDRLLVTSHGAFGHMVEALDLVYIGAVIPGTDDSAEVSAAQIDALIAQIEQTGVQAVFAEAAINPSSAELIAQETGATVYAGDEALYGDSLGPEGSAGATYTGSQIHNVSLLLRSWGKTPTPLPDELVS